MPRAPRQGDQSPTPATGDATPLRPDPADDEAVLARPGRPGVPPLIRFGGAVSLDAILAAAETEEDDGEDDPDLRTVCFKLSRDLQKRLDKYLTDRIPFMSRAQLQRLIDVGAVTVNDKPSKASTKLRLGDSIRVVIPPPPVKEIQPEQIPLDILHEDQWLIVLNKSPNLLVHPARAHHSGTLLNALMWHLRHVSPQGGGLSKVGDEFARPGVVHRLDRHTSGVMVVAKDDEAHWKLARQFENRTVDKRYLAVVEGEIQQPVEVLDAPIGQHPNRSKGMREKQVVRHDELGKPAVTICRVRERFKGFTLVELELKTGRTHQIRVHLSHWGHPLAGDDMYGGRVVTEGMLTRNEKHDRPIMSRQALHACILGFTHPMTGAPMVFTVPAAPDMRELVSLLRAHRGSSGVQTPAGATIDLSRALAGA